LAIVVVGDVRTPSEWENEKDIINSWYEVIKENI